MCAFSALDREAGGVAVVELEIDKGGQSVEPEDDKSMASVAALAMGSNSSEGPLGTLSLSCPI